MLYPLLIQLVHDLTGLSPAALYEEITGFSRSTYRRGAYEALIGRRRASFEKHRDERFISNAIRAGATRSEAEADLAATPDGIASQLVHSLGLLDENCTSHIRTLVTNLDEADLRAIQLAEAMDLEGLNRELSALGSLGPNYSQVLSVTGIGLLPSEHSPGGIDRALRAFLHRRANMALSLLAAIDLEIGHWNERVWGGDPFSGRARFACLLSAPRKTGGLRSAPRGPYSRLVDLIGTMGERVRSGNWPERPPTISAMGTYAERNRAVAGNGERFIRNLRNGKTKFTNHAFRQLLQSQLAQKETDQRNISSKPALADGAGLLKQYLIAAHLFSYLMPSDVASPTERDRTGWRDAYLARWRTHSLVWGPTAELPGPKPPLWLDAG